MIGLLLILASQFLFTSGYNRTYTLDPESKSFWIYVKVSKNATQNWTFCLNYDSESESDPTVPGEIPEECNFNDNDNNAFVAISGNYFNKSLNIGVRTSTINSTFILGQGLDNSKTEFVFQFLLFDPRADYVRLDLKNSTIPRFIRDGNQTITMVTNSISIQQITPSLPQSSSTSFNHNLISMSENQIAQEIVDEDQSRQTTGAFDDLDATTTKNESQIYTTKLTVIQQLIEESKQILPLTVKRSAKTSSTTPRLTRKTMGSTKSVFPSTKTTQHHKNEEERLMDLLMNPRSSSKIEFIGNHDTDEDDTPPELIMFEIGVKRSPPPFIPTFNPLPFGSIPPSTTKSDSSCNHPCENYPEYPYPQYPYDHLPYGPSSIFTG